MISAYSQARNGWCVFKRLTTLSMEYVTGPFKSRAEAEAWINSRWDCKAGTPDEDHNWKFNGGDPDVGLQDELECRECGATMPYDGRFDGED